MDHPFINASSLSDDELFKRMTRCQEIAYNAMMAGHTTMYESAVSQYETYQAEYNDRMARRSYEEYVEKNPDGTIEIGEINDISNLRGDTDGKSNNRGQPQKRR